MSGPGPEFDAFVERYLGMWNEPDAAARRGLIEALWTPEGANFVKSKEWRGYPALEERVRGSWEKWVRDGKCLFRAKYADTHHGAARVAWEMVSAADGRVISVGHEVLLFAAGGRISEDYQFVVPGDA